MKKPKILFCSEATFLNTGYAIYTKEVLKYLHSTEKYEIAELASYGERNDPRGMSLPWRYYGVMPNTQVEPKASKEEQEAYGANPSNQFGAWAFEAVCLDFMPDVVCDIRDFWMMSHEETSPFRPYYHLVWMPTVDAYPQSRQWIASYAQCDACFTYSNWAGQVLTEQSGGKIKWRGSAPPCASKEFQPIWDKESHKKEYGIDPSFKIIGTVMRNQRRKLYPDLFAAFRKFLDASEDKKFYLYCHTSYPDLGWDIPELIQEHDLSAHILFTYICHETGKFFPSLFRGPIAQSPFTGKWGATLSNVKRGLNDTDLAKVYNLFDLYVQYANCLAKDQKILTNHGWTNIQDVKVGDMAWTHKNRWRPVTHTWVNLEKSKYSKMLEVKAHGDYETLQATEDHEAPAYTLNEFGGKQSVREQIGNYLRNNKSLPEMGRYRLDQLKPGDIIGYSIDDSVKDVNNINLEEYCEADYSHKDILVDEDFCKWLGLYVADGSANLNDSCGAIKITSHLNENTCHELCDSVMSNFSEGGVKTYLYKDRQALNKEIFNKPFTKYIRQNCKKLEEKQFPQWVLKLPLEKQKRCLQGLFMGDGHLLERRGGKVSILCTISKTLADQVKEMLRRLRVSFNVRKVTKDGNRKPQYRFEINGDIKAGEFVSDRHNSRSFYYGQFHYVQIKSIETVEYNDDVYCITVNEDHTMLTPLGLVFQCEGFGIPMVEAASCGIPIMGTDYSAMESVIRELGGFPIKPRALYKELETGCLRAVPDNDLACSMFKDFFALSTEERLKIAQKTKELCSKDFNIQKTGSQWEKVFDELPQRPFEQTWGSAPRIKQPAQKPDASKEIDFHKLARWLIVNVLCEPERLNSYMEARLARDLMYRTTTSNVGGMYFNESSAVFDGLNFRQDFNFDIAYNQMLQLCDRRNQWEQARINKIKNV